MSKKGIIFQYSKHFLVKSGIFLHVLRKKHAKWRKKW